MKKKTVCVLRSGEEKKSQDLSFEETKLIANAEERNAFEIKIQQCWTNIEKESTNQCRHCTKEAEDTNAEVGKRVEWKHVRVGAVQTNAAFCNGA